MCKITEEVEAAHSLPCKDGVPLFSFVLPTHVHTPLPRCELCLLVRKTKERHLLLAPAWLQVRVKDHLSPGVLHKRLLWRGPSLPHASTRLPTPPPVLALYLRGLRKPQDYIKHSLSARPVTAINTWALKRLQGPALSVRDPAVVGWGQLGTLPAHASGKAARCPGDLSGQPSSLPCLCGRACFWCYSLSVCCCCRDRMAHTERALPWLLLLALALLGSSTAERDCRVSSFKVKENFDKTRVNLLLSWICDVLPSSSSQATKSGIQ